MSEFVSDSCKNAWAWGDDRRVFIGLTLPNLEKIVH